MSAHSDAHEEAILDLALGGEHDDAAASPSAAAERDARLAVQIGACDACNAYALRLLWDLPALAAGLGLDATAARALEHDAIGRLKRALAEASDRAADSSSAVAPVGSPGAPPGAQVIPFRRRALQVSALTTLAAAAAVLLILRRPDDNGIKSPAGAGALTVEVVPGDDAVKRDEVAAALELRRRALDACASGVGAVQVRLRIESDGTAGAVEIVGAEGDGARWQRCFDAELRRVAFPMPSTPAAVELRFSRDAGARDGTAGGAP